FALFISVLDTHPVSTLFPYTTLFRSRYVRRLAIPRTRTQTIRTAYRRQAHVPTLCCACCVRGAAPPPHAQRVVERRGGRSQARHPPRDRRCARGQPGRPRRAERRPSEHHRACDHHGRSWRT